MKQWKDIRRGIRAQPHEHGRDAEAFWSEFRRRAGEPRAIETPAFQPKPRLAWGMAWAACAALVSLLAGGGWWIAKSGEAMSSTASHVNSIQISACHDALMIMQDPEHQGTIVWIDLCPAIDNSEQEVSI